MLPLAYAHDGHNNGKDKTVPGPNLHCWPTQNPHDYVGTAGASADIDHTAERSTSALYVRLDVDARGSLIGGHSTSDHNTENCDNHDSTKQGPAHPGDADFDGDMEFGYGGGFFPAGFWADEPICQRGLTPHHDTNVHVHDAVWPPDTPPHDSVGFFVGADPSPPTVVTIPPVVIDPDRIPDSGDEIPLIAGGVACITDGSISPGFDRDDWLKPCLHKCDIFPAPESQATNFDYGRPGGDGGFHVWVATNVNVDEFGFGATTSFAGHIYFPNTWPGKTAQES